MLIFISLNIKFFTNKSWSRGKIKNKREKIIKVFFKGEIPFLSSINPKKKH